MIPFEVARDDTKFDERGRALPHYGNTIISFMNTREWPIYTVIKEVQEEVRRANFSQKLAFLPLDSLHMTILPLLKERDRGTALWPSYIDSKVPFREADCAVYKRASEVPTFDSVSMKIRGVNITGVHLEPADEESTELLKVYRDKIAEVTEIKQEDHEEYNFHVTFAYVTADFSEEEMEEAEAITERLSKEVLKRLSKIIVPKPYFTVFNDMTKYSTDLSFRGNQF